jgi:hypothetical protein
VTDEDKEFTHIKIRAKYKTRLNIVWGKPIGPKKKEALAYPEGFPATIYMTDRRVFVIGTFMEKRGLLRKKSLNTLYFEAGLQYVDKVKLEIYKKVKSGYISFKKHGDLENGIIHFLRLTPDMIRVFKEIIKNAENIKRVREDTGLVVIGDNPIAILKNRLTK